MKVLDNVILRYSEDFPNGLVLYITVYDEETYEYVDSTCFIDATNRTTLLLLASLRIGDRVTMLLKHDPRFDMVRLEQLIPSAKHEIGIPLVNEATFKFVDPEDEYDTEDVNNIPEDMFEDICTGTEGEVN